MIVEENVYTREETSNFLKISKSTFMRMVKSGAIRAFKVGSQYRVLGSEILKIINPKLEKNVQQVYRNMRTKVEQYNGSIKGEGLKK